MEGVISDYPAEIEAFDLSKYEGSDATWESHYSNAFKAYAVA
jgi:hypothetical protein